MIAFCVALATTLVITGLLIILQDAKEAYILVKVGVGAALFSGGLLLGVITFIYWAIGGTS